MVSVAQIKGLIGCAGYLCGMLAGGAGNDIYLLARGDGADRIGNRSPCGNTGDGAIKEVCPALACGLRLL